MLPEYLKYFITGFQNLPVIYCRSKLSIPRQERICTRWRKKLLGDQFHFSLNVMVLKSLGYNLYQSTRIAIRTITQF